MKIPIFIIARKYNIIHEWIQVSALKNPPPPKKKKKKN